MISSANDHVNFVKIDVDESQNLTLEERVTVCYFSSFLFARVFLPINYTSKIS